MSHTRLRSFLALAKQIGGPKPVWCPTPEDPDTGYVHGLWDGKVEGNFGNSGFYFEIFEISFHANYG